MKHRNSFGLTLSDFPCKLLVSTHRLLSGSEAGGLSSISTDSDVPAEANTIVVCISSICSLGLESCSAPDPYNLSVLAVAEKYRSSAIDQQLITTLNHDVNTSKLCSVQLDPGRPSWSEEDWRAIAGIERKSFTGFEDKHSGQSNMQLTLKRVLLAIAQAETLCQAAGRGLNLSSLDVTFIESDGKWNPRCRQNVKLQSLDVEPSLSLRTAFSRLTAIDINVNDCCDSKELEDENNKIEKVLQVLLSSTELKVLYPDFVDDGEFVDEYNNMSSMSHPGHIWNGDYVLSKVIETERSNGLQQLSLSCIAIFESRDALEKLIRRHAATLEVLRIHQILPDPMAVTSRSNGSVTQRCWDGQV